MTRARVLRGRYVDSVVLMRLARELASLDGVDDAAAMMGTDANKALLADGGFLDGPVEAGPNDLVVAVKGASGEALGRVEELLEAPAAAVGARTLAQAAALRPSANVAVISVPGAYAAAEARTALELGLHVFLFSSNVPLEQELELKQLAAARGLLCMGPDCGTALIAGKGLGFANAVRRGPVGVVGASGTGIQAVTALLDRFGAGVSHAIGCGSRDLSEAVAGATAFAGLEALAADAATSAIAVVSKPPAPAVAARIRAWAATAPKPVVLGFIGDRASPPTLAALARAAAGAAGAAVPDQEPPEELPHFDLAPSQRFLRGLYAGGTLAYEAQLVLREAGIPCSSNAPLRGERRLASVARSEGHTILDLGAEELTLGRPHPMIDARLRCARLLQEAEDPQVAVVLLDVVLGYGAARDPAGDLAGAIGEARALAARDGRELAVLAHVLGTERDPQGLRRQERTLRRAGAVLLTTSSAMVEAAISLATREPAAALVGSAR